MWLANGLSFIHEKEAYSLSSKTGYSSQALLTLRPGSSKRCLAIFLIANRFQLDDISARCEVMR